MAMDTDRSIPGCRRGIFGLKSWEALRKPGSRAKQQQSPARQGTARQSPANQVVPVNNQPRQETRTNSSVNGAPKPSKKVQAKYNYKANPNSPLGKELTINPLEKLTVVSDANEHWWMVRNMNGDSGFVPATYLIEEEEATPLPWLQNQPVLDLEEPGRVQQQTMTTAFGVPENLKNKTYKSYNSAYGQDEAKDGKKWHCELCNKTLNGPKPYSAHIASRAHAEEEEYARETGRI